MFQSDVTVLTLFSNEFVWSESLFQKMTQDMPPMKARLKKKVFDSFQRKFLNAVSCKNEPKYTTPHENALKNF